MPARHLLAILIAACALVATGVAVNRITAADAARSSPAIVGTWLLTITPPGQPASKVLSQSTPDGTTIGLDSAPSVPATQQDLTVGTVGGGTWVSAGGNRFKTRGSSIVTDTQGRFAGLWTVLTTQSVSGNALTGKSDVTMSAPDGRVLFHTTATFTGKRLSPPAV